MLGFIEFADAAYKRFDEMAQLVVIDIRARETGEHRAEWRALKRDDHPDLRGGMSYVDSPRHANYVDSATYQDYLAQLRDRFGWPAPDEHSFDALVTDPAAETQLSARPLAPAPGHTDNSVRVGAS
ncbi:hypothetical protein [uncultured Jatrophihabitans sp.]|uniref:hypothetical protein n=1 Tax=uncultured Jatrophihabitans sp. TaxID=1610747 RepID=UPI0035CBFD8E